MKKYFWLGLIILLFLVTRLYRISEVPGSVYWDEASIGYNAYSITTDLKDEWGEFLPLHFRAFGEFKLPVYIYSVAVLTKIFGVNEFTLRLPAVLYSLGTILVTYLLVLKIAKKESVALLSSFVLVVSPWLFIFSRTGYEATAGLFFFLLFVYFLLFHGGSKTNILLAAIFAVLSFYSYNSFRILIPIFATVWFFKEKKKPLFAIIALVIFALTLIPTIKLYRFDQGASRLTTVGIKDPKTFIANYFSHFDYKFLYDEGDINDRSQVPGWGELYLIELPLFIMGLISLLKNKDKDAWVFASFLLIGAIPAALTRESPHALRSILLAPTFSIIASMGIWKISEFLKKNRNLFLGIIVGLYLSFFLSYFIDFINNYNSKTYESWQLPYKNMFISMEKSGINQNVVISDEYAQPYIFALYYLKYSPQEFRSSVSYNSPDKWGFSTVERFGNFQFKKL